MPSDQKTSREVPPQKPVDVHGVWLRVDRDGKIAVDVELSPGEWFTVIRERHFPDTIISHIVEPNGIRVAPHSDI